MNFSVNQFLNQTIDKEDDSDNTYTRFIMIIFMAVFGKSRGTTQYIFANEDPVTVSK